MYKKTYMMVQKCTAVNEKTFPLDSFVPLCSPGSSSRLDETFQRF